MIDRLYQRVDWGLAVPVLSLIVLAVTWTAKPDYGFDSAWFEPANDGPTLSGATHLDISEKTGYIRVSTQPDCTWTVKVSQSVRSYVRV